MDAGSAKSPASALQSVAFGAHIGLDFTKECCQVRRCLLIPAGDHTEFFRLFRQGERYQAAFRGVAEYRKGIMAMYSHQRGENVIRKKATIFSNRDANRFQNFTLAPDDIFCSGS